MSTLDSADTDRLPAFLETAVRICFPRTEQQREQRRIVALSLPFVALAVFGALIPLWEMARISVSTAQFRTVGFSLAAYETLVSEPKYLTFAFNSLWFATLATVLSVSIGIGVAHGLEKYDLPAQGLLVTLLSFPISLPGIVAAFMILVLLGETGLLTHLLVYLSGESPATFAVATGLGGLLLGYLYSMIPRSTFLLRGAYAEVNSDAEEAARALGASPTRVFYHVTLPQIRPGLIGSTILTFRTGLAIFGTVLVLPALDVVTLRISREVAVGYNIQAASAMGVVFFVFTVGFTFLGLRYTSAEVGR